MSEMAKTAREAMKAKAKRLGSSGPTEKVDSSTFTPPELLNAQAKTGMRPVSRRTYKSGGKVQGECAPVRADRKQRKAGGKAEKADDTPMIDRKINRDLKKANEYREGIKHVGALKRGGRTGRAEGGSMKMLKDIAKNTDKRDTAASGAMGKDAFDDARQLNTMVFQSDFGEKPGAWKPEKVHRLKKGGRTGKAAGGGNNVPLPPKRPPQSEIDAMEALRRSKELEKYIKAVPEDLPPPPETRKHGGRTKKNLGGMLKMLSPIAMLASLGGDDDDKKARGGRTKKQMGGPMGDPRASGQAMLDGSATVGGVPKELLAFAPSMPSAGMKKHLGLKSGGKAKHTDEAMDMALIKKMVKPEARAKRQDGGGVFSGSGYPGKVPGVVPGGRMARKGGGRAGKNKGTNINIIISPGKGGGPGDMQAPMPNMPSMPSQGNPPMLPPGAPPMPPQMGGAPGMPPMPPRPPQGGPPPFKKGGRVYRSYKDMDAGSGSGLGRLEKSEIQSRR